MTESLGDVLHLKRRFMRSVSLERDAQSGAGLEGYVPTPSAVATKSRIESALENPSLRAVSITGAYGTGKSVFALYIAKHLARISDEPGHKALLPVFITGEQGAIVPALMRGLDIAVYGQAALDYSDFTAKDAVERFAQAAKDVQFQNKGYSGLLVVIDELGKFLEFATHHPERGDLQFLQEMAEMAVRSGDAPVLFVTILHQAFEEYANSSSTLQRVEWQKVQGRFVDIPFGDNSEDIVRLIGQAFETEGENGFAVARAVRQAEQADTLGILPRGLPIEDAIEIFTSSFGLHPSVLLALPPLFKRFAQSERTLFSFLSSDDLQGFGAYIYTQPMTLQYRLDALFDYISDALSSMLYSASGYGKMWSQIKEAVARCENRGNALEARIVKTVGLLHLLGEVARLSPSADIICFALADENTTEGDIRSALSRLTQATILVFRTFKNAYRPYEGSDIDVEERLSAARSALGNTVNLSGVAEKRLPLTPIIARRHLFKTGTLRFFEVSLCALSDIDKRIKAEPAAGDGSLLLCLTSDDAEHTAAVEKSMQFTDPEYDRPHVVVAVCLTSEELRAAAFMVESLEWVRENTPELADDPIASREVSERRYEAFQRLEVQWERLLSPEFGVLFVWQGARQNLSATGHEIQQFLSHVFAEVFSRAPILRNELLNRRQVSSTAAAARRNLIEAMITKHHLPHLDINGFPAERMMYETLLSATGLHGSNEEAEDLKFLPVIKQPDALRVAFVWQEIEQFLLAGDLRQKPITQIYETLKKRPYGITDGILPVFLVAALICWQDEVLLYESGSLVTQLEASVAERFLRRPQDFKAHGIRIAGERQAVLNRFGKGLLKSDEARSTVNVVRRIYAQFGKLPIYTRSTRRLEDTAKRLRDALKEARNPDHFLFVDLPLLFNVKPFTAQEDDDNVDAFFALWNKAFTALTSAYDALLNRLQNNLLEFFEVDSINEVRLRASNLIGRVSEPKLVSFVSRLANVDSDGNEWIASVAAGILGRAPGTWVDADEERFVTVLPSLVIGFRSAEAVVFAMNDAIGQADETEQKMTAMRVSIATSGGHEESKVFILSSTKAHQVEVASDKLRVSIRNILEGQSTEVQMAALGYVMREMLQESDKGQ